MRRNAKRDDPWILGISASHHNAAVCLLKGSRIVVAIQEERLTGVKRSGFSAAQSNLSIPYCLKYAGIKEQQLAAIGYSTAGASVYDPSNDIHSNPWFAEISNSRPFFPIPHHFCHAMSAYALSGFHDSAILVIDGRGSPVGDLPQDEQASCVQMRVSGWEHISLYEGSGNKLRCLQKHLTKDEMWLRDAQHGGMKSFSSFGAMYSAVARQLFGEDLEAGKVMGLAPYGTQVYPVEQFYGVEDGDYAFRNDVPDAFPFVGLWPAHEKVYRDLAASVQAALENAVLHAANRLARLTQNKRLSYAGGVALNCTANEALIRSGLFEAVFIPPAAEDSGVAIGAAYAALSRVTEHDIPRQQFKHDSCGAVYAKNTAPEGFKLPYVRQSVHKSGFDAGVVAKAIADGSLCAWFDGGAEFGPRSLGYRSLLADPRPIGGKEKLNLLKGREAFRPLAPLVLQENAADWFEVASHEESPFMLRTWKVRECVQNLVPVITHIDGSARVQTVRREINPRLAEVLDAFEQLTGVPILVNTSFNLAGEPIVETPVDAMWTAKGFGIDILMLNGDLFERDQAFPELLEMVPGLTMQKAQPEHAQSRLLDAVSQTKVSKGGPQTLWHLLDLIDGHLTGGELCTKAEAFNLVKSTREFERHLLILRRRGLVELLPRR